MEIKDVIELIKAVSDNGLTGFKIDIKSETQAREAGDFDYVEEEEYEEEDNYDESAAEEETISAEENFDENDVETAEKAGDEE